MVYNEIGTIEFDEKVMIINADIHDEFKRKYQ